MSWILIAILSAAVQGLISILDKFFIHKYVTTPLTLPLLIGMAQGTVGLFIVFTVGIGTPFNLEAVMAALASGVLFGIAGVLGMRVLFSQEVSRTTPVVQSAPIFAALLAFIFLRESISVLQWFAIVLTVIGSAMLSVHFGKTGSGIFSHKSFYLLMLAALFSGATNVVGKVALEELPVLLTHGYRMLALGGTFLLFSLRSEPLRDVLGHFSRRNPALLVVATNEFVLATIGILLLLWALAEGPVSLVTALSGTRALFIVIYSTTLAMLWRGALGEDRSLRAVTQKMISSTLIVIGIVAIVA